MKKIYIIPSLILAFAFILSINMHLTIAQQAAVPFDQTKTWNKLDDGVKAAWQDAMKSGDVDRRIDCFVRVKEMFDRGDESFLFDKGFNVRAISGPIATGNVAAKDLQDVANLPFVASIKLATKK